MKKLAGIIILFSLLGCGVQEKTLVGRDKDTHGCIASAGYTWSEVRGACIRVWEEGKKLLPVQQKEGAVLAAYVITEKRAAEVFLPDNKKPIQMVLVYAEEASRWEAKDGSGWELVEDAFGEWSLYKKDTLLYTTKAGKI